MHKLRKVIEIEIERVQLDHATLEMATEVILSLFSSTIKEAMPKEKKKEKLLAFYNLAVFYKKFFEERGYGDYFITDTIYGHLAIATQNKVDQALKDFTSNLEKKGILIK